MDNKLKERWWWRLLVAIYILAWSLAIMFILMFASFHRPYTKERPVYLEMTRDQYQQKYGTSVPTSQPNMYMPRSAVPVERYVIGSWSEVAVTLITGFAIAFVAIESVKSALLYVLGVSIWRGVLYYPQLILKKFNVNTEKNTDHKTKDKHIPNFVILVIGSLMILSGLSNISNNPSDQSSYLTEGGVLVYCGALAYLARKRKSERSSGAWQYVELGSIIVFILVLFAIFRVGGMDAAYYDPIVFFIIPAIACIGYALAWRGANK